MKKKSFLQRMSSALTASVVLLTSLPLSSLPWINIDLSFLHAKAEDENTIDLEALEKQFFMLDATNDYVLDGNGNRQPNNHPNFQTVDAFIEFCYCYREDPDFAAAHESDTLDAPFTNDTAGKYIRSESNSGCNFTGLGTALHPFRGSIQFDSSTQTYTLPTDDAPLFAYVCDNVELKYSGGILTTIQMERKKQIPSETSSPLFAQHVVDDGTVAAANWGIEILASNSRKYSGVIGEIEQGANVTLRLTNHSAMEIMSNASADDSVTDDVPDVGMICGKMSGTSTLNVTYSSDAAYTVTSANGNAGMLVGTMENGANLTVSGLTATSAASVTSANGYAGGLVGELTSAETVSVSASDTISINSVVTGGLGAGGLFGHYTNVSTGNFDIEKYNVTAIVDGQYCGGLFGVLENNSDSALSLTLKNTNNAGTLSVNSGTTGDTDGYFGGIAGKYTTNELSNSLILNGLSLEVNANAAYSAFGGAIGIVDSVAYLQTTNTMNVTATGTDKSTYFGGLVGATTSDSGVFVDLGSFTLNTSNEEFQGGGVVGQFNNGVLRLNETTTMTDAKPVSAANCGQLVGFNNNVLTYAVNGWTFNRSNGANTDDLGTWGEVVRGITDTSSENTIYFNSTNHTATIAAAETTIDSVDDFVRTALNIQLHTSLPSGVTNSCLVFSGSDDSEVLLGTNLIIRANISLSGKGITGFMRDGGDNVGCFSGTLDGTNDTDTYTITLATGENYGNGASEQTEGMGQIYRHKYNGLFSVIGGAGCSVSNLTVAGAINTHSSVDGMNIGGIAAQNGGDITLTKVISNVTVNDFGDVKGTKAAGKNIGGYIGFVGTNGSITINGVSSIDATFNLSGKKQDWNTYGGAIGKITAGTFNVNIGTKDDANNKLTNSLKTSITGITTNGENSDSGGLIGYITSDGSYGSRTVNLNNLEFSSCIVGNAASVNGGGFLGYAWLNTTTNVNGVTVSGTINNSAAPNVGVMLYSSTGKMKVDSLAINGLTMSSGGGTSLGMIVNRAFVGETKDGKTTYSGGLYLDVLNAGYTLNSGISVSSSVFDEIAAYSAMDASEVIKGGAGVISINMNAGRHDTEGEDINTKIKITETGTYQNRLKTSDSCANPNSRYYYNVDNMSSSDGGQNLVLWSLNKYAYSGISGEFGTTLSNTLSGTADLTGLSFYPLASANDNYTIGNLTLTFDYNGIYSTAENVSNTDTYIRDPAASNQHYLMHSGLFIDQPMGNTLTVSGNLSLGGTFLEDETHKGVLFSGTMYGNFACSGGENMEIKLDGLTPKNGASAYTDGYLLINEVKRADVANSIPPSLSVKNVYTTKKYSEDTYTAGHTNDTVAKSLIGNVTGRGIDVIFSHIKLDSRSGTVPTALAAKAETLWNVYGTYNSIFTQSTLLASIKTDQAATLEYNYTKAEDWGVGTPRYVTYGKEVKDSVEYEDEEQMYYPDANGLTMYTNPVDNTELSEVYNFSSGFLKYVNAAYSPTPDTNGLISRELKVNVQSVVLDDGCGSYNDPYKIDDAAVLTAIAKFISTGNGKDLKEIILPVNSGAYDTLAENTTGARWHNGENYHGLFKANTSGDTYTLESNSNITWTAENVRLYLAGAYYKINGNMTLTNKFLGFGCSTDSANGNYAFRGVIVGAKNDDGTPKYTITNNSSEPFIKVSNGSVVKDLNITVGADVTLNQTTCGSQNAYFGYNSQCKYYGGIIGEIMGGDNIIDNSYVTFASGKKVTLSGTYGMLCPVGSYVGVVVFGGLIFKNLNITTASTNASGFYVYCDGDTSGEVNLTGEDLNSAIYVNPYVGRVINGYAVNETQTNNEKGTVGRFSETEDGYYHDGDPAKEGNTNDDDTARTAATVQHSLRNGVKHYSIADINRSETNMLNVSAVSTNSTNGKIKIPNAQALFVLSLITQSGAGMAIGSDAAYGTDSFSGKWQNSGTENYTGFTIINRSLSYGTYDTDDDGTDDLVYGMSHIADYTNIGNAESVDDTDYILASSDSASAETTPYIITKYTTGKNARCVTSPVGFYDISLTAKTVYNVSSYTYVLPDSFRGIGSVGIQNNRYGVAVDEFEGNSSTIDEDIYLNRYAKNSDLDNYFDQYHWDTVQEYYTTRRKYNTNTNTDNHGIGLFDSVIMKSSSSGFKNFTLSGSVNTENYDLLEAVVPQVAEKTVFSGDDPDGLDLVISNKRGNTEYYMIGEMKDATWMKHDAALENATLFHFTKIQTGDHQGQYVISTGEGTNIQYLNLNSSVINITSNIDYFIL